MSEPCNSPGKIILSLYSFICLIIYSFIHLTNIHQAPTEYQALFQAPGEPDRQVHDLLELTVKWEGQIETDEQMHG